MLEPVNVLPMVFSGPVMQPKLASRGGPPLSDFDATPQPVLKMASYCPGAAQMNPGSASDLSFRHSYSDTIDVLS